MFLRQSKYISLNSVTKVFICKISKYFRTGAVVICKIFVVDIEIIFQYIKLSNYYRFLYLLFCLQCEFY